MQRFRPIAAGACAVVLAACSNEGARMKSEIADYNPPGTGPFDSRGNYVESWADSPSKWRGRSIPKPPSLASGSSASGQQQKQARQSSAATARTESRPTQQPTTVAATTPAPAPKPKPKPAPTKPKKPAPVRVTVKKGDTLYGIAKRNGSTVTAIKKANGLKSDLIRPGQRLLVPKY